jgi:peptidoglycan hydrolase-like protein with peptidoglycan-binding domain
MKGWILIGVVLMTACLLLAPPALAVQGQMETKTVTLIKGLDGGTYEPYSPDVIEKVQASLKDTGFYAGEINGELDEATMNAIGEFQKENQLTVSGVPSPSTRRLLVEE